MTLLDVEELARYWADHPPVHLMVAAYLGLKDHNSVPSLDAPVESMPAALFGVPGLGPTRPISEVLGPNAVSDIRSIWQQYDTARMP